MNKKHIALMAILSGIIFFGLTRKTHGWQETFYLGTDKTFGLDESPYVNLEGQGENSYKFRVYEVKDPLAFLKTRVDNRLAKENTEGAFADPLAMLQNTWSYFKDDFREVARNELNVKTRSQLKQSAQVEFNGAHDRDMAIPEILKGHRFLTSFEITETKNAWFYKRVPVPVNGPGFYLIEAVNKSSVGYTVVIKSNINFITKQSDDQTLVFAAEKDTGKPLAGATVTQYNLGDGSLLDSGKTAANGIFFFKNRTPAKSVIVLSKDNHYAVSDPQFYTNSFFGRGGVAAYLYTDRPVYRPGHRVEFKGIVRRFAASTYRLTSGGGYCDVINGAGKTVLTNIPVQVSNDMGTFSGGFDLPGDESMFLGTYHLVLNYNAEKFSTEFQVEAYKKPPFLVKVTTEKDSYIQNQKVVVSIAANYYYGAPVAKAKVMYRVFRKPRFQYSPVGTLMAAEMAKDYLGLEGPAKSDLVIEKTENLDAGGKLQFSFTPEKMPEDYDYSITASVTDSSYVTLGGAKSVAVNRGEFFINISRDNMIYSPGESVTLKTTLVNFDKNLTPEEKTRVLGGKKIRMTLYTRDFTHISAEKSRKKVFDESYTTDKNGESLMKFKIPDHGHYVVAMECEDSAGEEITAQTTLWSSGKSDSIQVPFKNLTLKPGKDFYGIGESAEVLILSPVSDGNVLITLEGNSIMKYETVEMKGNALKYTVKITDDMVPNFTIAATQFSGGDIYKSEIKIVTPPKNKVIELAVKPDKAVYKPGETVILQISAADYKNRGIESEVSISVVDEAIYQIQPDKNPSLLSFFYHPRRNNVQTTLSTSYRFFGYSEDKRLKLALQKGKNSALAQIKDEKAKARENFKDTAYWTAKVHTDGNGKAEARFVLPDNLTTWRVNAVAVTADTSVGEKKVTFISKKDVMLISHLPAYLYNNQVQTVSVNAVNTTNTAYEVAVSLQVENAKSTDPVQKIQLGPLQTKPVYFTITPDSTLNAQNVTFEFKLNAGSLTDGLKKSIPVKPFGIEKTQTVALKLDSYNAMARREINFEKSFKSPTLSIQLSPGYGEAVKESLAYLADYPYGCIEQTMSRFMPLLAAKKAGFISPYLKNKLPEMVKTGFQRIRLQQNNDGGFGWFSAFGEKTSDPLMTAYVYRGLALSHKLGETPDFYSMNRARSYLYDFLAKNKYSTFVKAYILFSLSEGGKIEDSMVKSLTAQISKENAYTMSLVSLVLIAGGNQVDAKKIFLDAYAKSGFDKASSMTYADIKIDSIENDPVESASMLLLGALRLNLDEQIVENLSSILLVNRRGLAWKNSRDTSMAVLALSERLEKIRDRSGYSRVEIFLNKELLKTVEVSPSSLHEGDYTISFEAPELNPGKNEISFEKKTGSDAYIMASLAYFDESANQKSVNNGFAVTRNYYKIKSERTSDGLKLKAGRETSFAAGDIIMVEIETVKTGDGDIYTQIDDPLPPGFSFLNNDTEYYSSDFRLEYQQRQVFDSRVSFFLATYEKKATIRYFMTAELPGEYKILPALTRLMYFPQVQGNSSEGMISVRQGL